MGAVGEEELLRWEKVQAAAAANGSKERILVSVRLRPLSDKEVARNEVSDWECINDNTIIFRNSLQERSMVPTACSFDRVFRGDCSTKQVYEEAAKEVALSVVSGINSSIFAYGQTSSGKTYTMNGITEYTVADIYGYIQRHEERAFVLKFSAMEIYNEAVKDLLGTDGTPLRLLDDPERGTIVEKLTEETLRDWSHMRQLLSICEAQRQVGETSLNEASSRSHQILRLTIESSAREFLGKDNSSTLAASVNFVDLAGSERASQALSAGARLKEGCHINRSLLTLGTVIRKLSKGRNGHIPYRDSKLTRILQPSLGGNARTAIICTMSPARSHIEQSRNTLLFATCAKEVVTSAQVNVVMSDKALVKHLQKELARLESELRSPGPISSTTHSDAHMRKKDAQIQKMEKEIKMLTEQRDLAQSRLEILLHFIGHDRASRLWAEYDHPAESNTRNACDELSVSESLVAAEHPPNFSFANSNTNHYSKEYSGADVDEQYLQLSNIAEDQVPLSDSTHRLSVSSPAFVGLASRQGREINTSDDSEDLCKEVRCIETGESIPSRYEEPIEVPGSMRNERPQTLTLSDNTHSAERELESIEKRNGELKFDGTDFTYGTLKQQLQDVQKTINNLVEPYSDEFSPSCLTKSQSCRGALMISSSSLWAHEENGNTPPSRFEKDFPSRPGTGSFRKRPRVLKYDAEIETLSRDDSQTSECSASIDTLKSHNIKSATEENITSVRSFVAGLKEMAKLQYEKQLIDGQDEEPQGSEESMTTEKTLKDAGVDPMQIPLESPSRWPLEFERLQRDIIDLWDACNTSLVHRTYFFLLFNGDQSDSIYMEVELRRLSFLKNTLSQSDLGKNVLENGRIVTPATSMKVLRREREMLSKQMQKRFSEVERENLYQKWGIALDTKQRKLQLAYRLWIDTGDMEHIRESAIIVAKLIGFVEPGQAMKEMFGLSFTPRKTRTSRRALVWKNSFSTLV
ncbi:hypothetical protein MRB53_000947 [Persea americana]|uniref:Uncharacterized protein n=1 Tax=Persea americana TaxID=3435 RepID=A0ACC2MRC6_PERAE|nr:hypothetical protein MRB53_000947 [Persea americana]|eukprot:TRINITY_DN17453_c0_g1_i3.p1 TRINITY_DN17453_c0_g1~~TRINITY_DN17453_c0_g1_i3.p1  ORF type:complete len:976 (+),score=219.77 TRINITY_DN17453_c0_g1_i3:400-3327(+)